MDQTLKKSYFKKTKKQKNFFRKPNIIIFSYRKLVKSMNSTLEQLFINMTVNNSTVRFYYIFS